MTPKRTASKTSKKSHVTQGELRELLRLENLIERKAHQIGRRIKAGETVSAGRLTANISLRLCSAPKVIASSFGCGLEVNPT